MNSLITPVIILVAAAGVLSVVSGLAYNQGRVNATSELEAQGLTTYIEVMESIRDENVDLSDDAAVAAELCRLAGFAPEAPECGGL
mgnify:CR=1 FL=1|tara:strand:+ start:13391 stop:13648 length:258 start_codon:yes stop_codon:yes gene_type:complete